MIIKYINFYKFRLSLISVMFFIVQNPILSQNYNFKCLWIWFVGVACLNDFKFKKITIKTIYFFINLLPSSKQDRAA